MNLIKIGVVFYISIVRSIPKNNILISCLAYSENISSKSGLAGIQFHDFPRVGFLITFF
jgi:hypothetical protein